MLADTPIHMSLPHGTTAWYTYVRERREGSTHQRPSTHAHAAAVMYTRFHPDATAAADRFTATSFTQSPYVCRDCICRRAPSLYLVCCELILAAKRVTQRCSDARSALS